MFSIYLDPWHVDSKIVYGGIPPMFEDVEIEYFQNIENTWTQVVQNVYESNHWKLRLTHVKFADFQISAPSIILDTGCTLHQAPKSFISQLVAQAEKLGLSNFERIGKSALYSSCTDELFEKLPALKFYVEGRYIVLKRDRWVRFSHEIQMCAILFQELPGDRWHSIILGYEFFK